jgi:hypothetical protein
MRQETSAICSSNMIRRCKSDRQQQQIGGEGYAEKLRLLWRAKSSTLPASAANERSFPLFFRALVTVPAQLLSMCTRARARAQWTGDGWRVTGLVLNDGQSLCCPWSNGQLKKTHFTYIIQRTRLSSKLFFKCILWKKKKFTKKKTISLKKCIESHPVIFFLKNHQK